MSEQTKNIQIKTIRKMEGKRLAYYREAATNDYWDKTWADNTTTQRILWAEAGKFNEMTVPFEKYLPKTGKIIEAGCGRGGYVLSLINRGYDAEGIDFASQTINTTLSTYPGLPIKVGDVTELDVPDGYYRGYISLGVVEHRYEGPEPFLKEAYRVLSDDGVGLISVPYMHIIRTIKAKLGFYHGKVNGQEFYQYAYLDDDFSNILLKHRFRIIDRYTYGGEKGFSDEIKICKRICKWKYIGKWFRKKVLNSDDVRKKFGHMMLYIIQKDI